jgi:hypothetical protein
MKKLLGIALIVAAAGLWWSQGRSGAPEPAPLETDIPLRGKFVGPTAAEDAIALSVMCDEIASQIEWDGMQKEPFWKTGVSLDALRIRTRSLLMKGESFWDRQPHACEAIGVFLTDRLGISGGQLTQSQRQAWVAAYRDIARAAEDAAH